MLFIAQLICLIALICVGLIFHKDRQVPIVEDGTERFRFPGWFRWTFYVIGLSSGVLAAVLPHEDIRVAFLFGLAVPLATEVAFLYCTRYFIDIRRSEIAIGKTLWHVKIPISTIQRVVIVEPGRSAKATYVFDKNDKRLFSITDNLRDYARAVGLLKLYLADGTVIEENGSRREKRDGRSYA